jgi:hypothetical protein
LDLGFLFLFATANPKKMGQAYSCPLAALLGSFRSVSECYVEAPISSLPPSGNLTTRPHKSNWVFLKG